MAKKKNIKGSPDIGYILYWVHVGFLALSVIVMIRIAYIQCFWSMPDGLESYFRPRDEKKELEPQRGAIIARDGRLLALSTPKYQLFMDCCAMKEANEREIANHLKAKPETKKRARKQKEEKKWVNPEDVWRAEARELAKGLSQIYGDKSAEGYYNFILNGRKNGLRYAKIGGSVDHETMRKLKELPLFNRSQNYGGCIFEKEDSRKYPYEPLALRTIGYVKDNSKSNGNNKLGIEGKFDYALHGKEGYEWTKYTEGKRRIRNNSRSHKEPVDGLDVRTTLDIEIQDIADKSLRSHIEGDEGLEGGCAVVMDVKTGAIRSMVNLLRNDKTGRLEESYNLVIGRKGEPGSVFKATTIMTLLEDGKIKSMRDEVDGNHGMLKGYKDQDRHIVDYEREHHTDKVPILYGLQVSSNYMFRKLAIDNYAKHPKKLLDKLYRYKLGEAFDFDLDGLASPEIPSPDSKLWSQTDLGQVAIGYSVSVTPLHVLTFYNAIANRGRMMKPYLVESIEKNGSVEERRGPSVLSASICSKSTADTLASALRTVVSEGTGKTRLGKAKCPVAGKTGTSRVVLDAKDHPSKRNPYFDDNGRWKNQGTFVGFFPADEPQYSVIVVVYSKVSGKSYYGGTIPAMVVREIVDKVYALDNNNGELLHKHGSVPKWQ